MATACSLLLPHFIFIFLYRLETGGKRSYTFFIGHRMRPRPAGNTAPRAWQLGWVREYVCVVYVSMY